MSALALADAIKQGTITPVQAVRASLQRAKAVQGQLNCMLALAETQALEDAQRIQDQLASGMPVGPLAGVPFTVKDLIDTNGVATTFGSLVFKDNIPDRDAVVVQRVRAAGAIMIGKTTTPEFGLGSLTEAPLFGRTGNAWHPGRTSGGSSGGAATAVAAGIAPLAIGSDGGGSARIPAACNGIVGFKQSHGLIPHSQAGDRFGNISYISPMARNTADTTALLRAMAGGHDEDPLTIHVADAPRNADAGPDLYGKVFHYALTPQGTPVSPCVRKAFQASLTHIEHLGGRIVPLPDAAALDAFAPWEMLYKTARLAQSTRLRPADREKLGPLFTRQLATCQAWSATDYQEAVEAKTRLFLQVQQLIGRDGFIVTPTMTRSALDIDQDFFGAFQIDGQSVLDLRRHWYPWTMLFNMTGHPAISLPCGVGEDGLPIGLQISGGFRADLELLGVASRIEQAIGPFPHPPALSTHH